MKNQNDLIISIVSIVLALILAGVFFGTKPEPTPAPAVTAVNLAPPQLPKAEVVYANELPASAAQPAGGGASVRGGVDMNAPAGPVAAGVSGR